MGSLHTLLYCIKEQGAEFNDRSAAATKIITAKFQFIAPCVITRRLKLEIFLLRLDDNMTAL